MLVSKSSCKTVIKGMKDNYLGLQMINMRKMYAKFLKTENRSSPVVLNALPFIDCIVLAYNMLMVSQWSLLHFAIKEYLRCSNSSLIFLTEVVS